MAGGADTGLSNYFGKLWPGAATSSTSTGKPQGTSQDPINITTSDSPGTGILAGLREVILGAASKTSIGDVRQAMKGFDESVRLSRMRLSCDKFELQEKPVSREGGQILAPNR